MNVFQILVVGVVAAILLYIALGLFPPSYEKTLVELKKGVDYAENTEGKLHEAEIPFGKDFAFKATALDSPARNVRMECTSADTCLAEKIVVDARQVLVKEQLLQRVFFRCKDKGILNDCVIYFGEKPAQLEIEGVVFAEPKKIGSATISFSVKNTGALDAIDSGYSLKLYSRKKDGNEEKELLVEEKTGSVKKLVPGQVYGVNQQFEVKAGGKYVLKLMVDGEDAGRAYWKKGFEVEDTAISLSCKATQEESALENNKCRVKHSCTGCEFGYECKQRWVEKGLAEGSITEVFPTGVYTEKAPIEGQCS